MKKTFEGSGSLGGVVTVDFRRLFEAAGAYLVLDPDFRIVAVTDAYLVATMRRREDLLGLGIFDAFPDNPDDAEASGEGNLRASLERVRDRRLADAMAVQKYDIERPADQGGGFEVRYWSPLNSPVLDDRGELAFITHRVEDVTEYALLREREAQTTERSQRMEEEILRRSAELQAANVQLRAANTAKDEFLARVSHELRNPLTAICGFSELLMNDEADETRRAWAAMISQASEHLSRLVGEVLDLARIESGNVSLSLEPVALEPLFADTLKLMEPLADSASVTLHPATSAAGHGYALADRHRLAQVLTNLVVNAIKYNREGGHVDIAVEPCTEHTLRIMVRDTGRGIAEDSIGRLFTPFERLDAQSAGIEGTGLGLALSRGLVELMGGRLTVESSLDVGSTFAIELPSGEPAAVEFAIARERPGIDTVDYSHESLMLYVEDTVANVRLIEAILGHRPSVRLISAMQGRLGLELARQHRPDLILLDLHLPDISGAAVLGELKSDAATSEIPVIILSAHVGERMRQPLLEAGATAYLTKPIVAADLLDAVDQHLLKVAT